MFSLSLDGAADVSLETAARQIFEATGGHEDALKQIQVELYKLNVYGLCNLLRQTEFKY